MKKAIALLLLLFPLFAISQNTYQQGYFIEVNGAKKECLIKNYAWKNNPVSIEYKFIETDEPKIKTIKEINEFGVGNAYKYKKYTVDVDRSSTVLDKLSTQKMPEWKNETVLLKIVVEGKLTLYQYEDNNLVKYFFSGGSLDKAEQLVYKQYNFSGTAISENNQFRQQLFNLMKDGTIKSSKFEKIKYKKDDLVALFMEYNLTTNQGVTNLTEKQNKSNINVKVTAGVNFSSLNTQSTVVDLGYDFGNKTTFRIGAELEYVMPFNNNKWSIFLDPNYQSYENGGKKENYEWKAKYQYAELPIGVRHYMYVNSDSKFFVDGAYTLAFELSDSHIQYNSLKLNITQTSNFALGAGYSYKKYSIEARYSFNHNIINYNYWNTEYNSLSMILGYRIF